MRYLFTLLIFSVIISPSSAEAAVDGTELLPWPKQVVYNLQYLEMPVGVMDFRIENGQQLSIKGNIKVAGVARLFSDHDNQLSLDIEGASPDGAARIFDTRYQSGSKPPTHIRLNYDAQGTLVDAVHEGVHDMDRRGKISDAQHRAALDPLSMMVALREKTYQAVQSKTPKFTTHLYDGKRLHQMDMTIYGTVLFEWRGQKVPVQKVGMVRKLVAGQTQKEIKREADFQLPEAVLYFTADQRFVPIYAKQSWKFGAFKAVMQ